MDPEIRTYLDETRRHFDVVAEQMRSQLQVVAEGVSSLTDRLDRLEQNLREEILRAQRELSAMIKFSYAELDRRIQGLEGQYSELERRVQRLETTR
jgi:DNA repair exonuclease SbcCD ATPase subunit